MSRSNCFILFADLMHKHHEFEQWNCDLFDDLFDKYQLEYYDHKSGYMKNGVNWKRFRLMVVRIMAL